MPDEAVGGVGDHFPGCCVCHLQASTGGVSSEQCSRCHQGELKDGGYSLSISERNRQLEGTILRLDEDNGSRHKSVNEGARTSRQLGLLVTIYESTHGEDSSLTPPENHIPVFDQIVL